MTKHFIRLRTPTGAIWEVAERRDDHWLLEEDGRPVNPDEIVAIGAEIPPSNAIVYHCCYEENPRP